MTRPRKGSPGWSLMFTCSDSPVRNISARNGARFDRCTISVTSPVRVRDSLKRPLESVAVPPLLFS